MGGQQDKGVSASADRATHEPNPQAVSAVPVGIADAARFYIDCEFDGHGGLLLSFAIVAEDGRGMHYEVRDVALVRDLWVAENVLPVMGRHNATEGHLGILDGLGWALRRFIGATENPVVIADSPVDIGRFCAAISTDADGNWASADYPLMRFEVHNVDCYPTDLPGAVQHNAWWDAMALRHKLAQGTPTRRAETTGSVGEADGGPVGNADAPTSSPEGNPHAK